MIDLLKRTLYVSVGIVSMTKEKVEELGKKIAEEAKLSETEGKQFVDELLKKSDETKAYIEKMIAEKTEAALKMLNIPSREELAKLEERISKLEGKSGQVTL